MEAERPKGIPLASFIASSKLSARIRASTGPKTSSWAMRIRAARQTIATTQQLGTLFLCNFDVVEVRFKLSRIDGGTHVDSRFKPVAHFQLPCLFQEFFNQWLINIFLDNGPAACGALLPG